MLQKQAISEPTLKLLIQLMSVNFLSGFAMAGGTSLALQIGHRISEDIDLFSDKDFLPDVLLQELNKSYDVHLMSTAKNTLNLNINDIKVDILAYKYPMINSVQSIEGVRLYSIEDIAAMKLSALSSRGSKKDFYDIYFLLQRYSLKELLEFFKIKFGTDRFYHILKSLVYFEDAEIEPDPILVSDKLNWNDIKSYFINLVHGYE